MPMPPRDAAGAGSRWERTLPGLVMVFSRHWSPRVERKAHLDLASPTVTSSPYCPGCGGHVAATRTSRSRASRVPSGAPVPRNRAARAVPRCLSVLPARQAGSVITTAQWRASSR